MVVPITGFGVMAKRVAQLSRRTGAITVPDLFRERFNSPAAGLISSLLIIFVMTFMMVAQFKAGAEIMKVVWPAETATFLSEKLAMASPSASVEGSEHSGGSEKRRRRVQKLARRRPPTESTACFCSVWQFLPSPSWATR